MMNFAPLSAIASPATLSPTADRMVVILHGWGADAQDLYPLAAELNLPNYQGFFVNAPFPHPHVPQGRSWYDLEDPNLEGLTEARQALQDYLLELEAQTRIPLSRTVLGGFSQGGAMSLDVGLTLPLAGIFSLSGYLHFQPTPSHEPWPPILMTHGTFDPVVPIAMAREAKTVLQTLGAQITYEEFKMGHEIPLPVVALLKDFLERVGGVGDTQSDLRFNS